MSWCIDVPDPHNPEGPWVFLRQFKTEEEAVAYVKLHFDGDDEGKIQLVTEIGEYSSIDDTDDTVEEAQ